MANYVIIAKRISWGGDFDFQDYYGEAVASNEAFFLILRQHQFEVFTDFSENPLGLLGGIVGFGIGDLSGRFAGKRTLYELNLIDLPMAITRDPAWPVKNQEDGRVIVVPRGVVERLRYSWWGPLKIYTEGLVFCLQPHFFFRGSTIRVLRDRGWKI